jgi:hypothetical protein
MRHLCRAAAVVGLAFSSACTLSSAPHAAADMRVQFVSGLSPAQVAAWPASPIVIGGDSLVVQGLFLRGCASVLAGRAVVDGSTLAVHVSEAQPGVAALCVRGFVPTIEPFTAVATGLPSGTYAVSIEVDQPPVRAQGTVALR